MFSVKTPQTIILPGQLATVDFEEYVDDSNTVYMQITVAVEGQPDEAGVKPTKTMLVTFQRDGEVITIHEGQPEEIRAEEPPTEPPPEEESDAGTETSKKKRKW